MPIIEIELDEKSAAELERCETLFCEYARCIKSGNAEKADECVNKAVDVLRQNPKLIPIHCLRPPKLFRQKDSADNVDDKFGGETDLKLLDEVLRRKPPTIQ